MVRDSRRIIAHGHIHAVAAACPVIVISVSETGKYFFKIRGLHAVRRFRLIACEINGIRIIDIVIAVHYVESGICKPALLLRRFQFRGKRPCAEQLSVAHKIAADQQGIRTGC